MLLIEQRLACDADGERVWVDWVESLRALGWARPKSYAGDR